MDPVLVWANAHPAVLSALGVALIDLAIALAPGLSQNGLLHGVYLWLKSASGTPKA